MISWMQKHNKYLVWTIWIATIAFIGAGFVGWGSYDFGSKAGNIAKVGDIEIKQSKLNRVYSNIYSQYDQAFKGNFDKEKAKEMGLIQQAFSQIEVQAKILNLSKDMGIIVSDNEIAKKLQEIKGFQKDGEFNKEIYKGYLKSQRLKAKDFEESLREEITIMKTFNLLTVDAMPLEIEALSAGMNVSDKIAYKILTSKDVNISMDETKIKAYWETNKDLFMTNKMYKLSILWTDTKDKVVTEDEVREYYNAKNFDYTDAVGKQLSYEEAKEKASIDLKIKNSKKIAQKEYIAFKKGKIQKSEEINIAIDDNILTPNIWKDIKSKSIGDIIKPKIVGDRYATIKIEAIIEPKVKTYIEAKDETSAQYLNQAQKEALMALAQSQVKEFDQSDAIISDFLKLDGKSNLKALNNEESLKFVQKLFTSYKEKGMISISDKIVVYSILEQKVSAMDKNETKTIEETVNKLKNNTFETNLIKLLDKKYPTEVYQGGLKN